jgi:hypothetical protein
MIWILRILNFILLGFAFWSLFFKPEFTRVVFIIIGFLFLISGLRKALIIGLDNLRGRFWVLLSLNGLIFPLASLLNSDILHLISRFYLFITLLFMFSGLRRQGLSLVKMKATLWLLLVATVIILSFLFSLIIENKNFLTYLYLFVLNMNFAILLANVLMYLGSDLGKRWFIGFLAFAFFFIGDPLYLINFKELAHFFFCFIFFFINIVAHIEE